MRRDKPRPLSKEAAHYATTERKLNCEFTGIFVFFGRNKAVNANILPKSIGLNWLSNQSRISWKKDGEYGHLSVQFDRWLFETQFSDKHVYINKPNSLYVWQNFDYI